MINVDLKIEITKRGLLEEGSLNYLFDLYLPLIGKDSAFLYAFLMNSIKTNRIFSTTNELINKCEMSLQEFLFAKKTLESIGLLSFYEKNDSSSYLYILNDVETPKNFFNNLVLKGLFIETVGEERFFEIISKYETKVNEEDYVNQSAKIQDSFQVIFDVKALDMNNDMIFVQMSGVAKWAIYVAIALSVIGVIVSIAMFSFFGALMSDLNSVDAY